MEFSEVTKVDRPEKPAEEKEEDEPESARPRQTKRQLSEHIKRFYSVAKRAIVLLALLSFAISTIIAIIRMVLGTNGGATQKQDIVAEVQKHLERLLQLTDLAFAPGSASAFRIGSVLGNNTAAAE